MPVSRSPLVALFMEIGLIGFLALILVHLFFTSRQRIDVTE
jgi:hypothetical protein